MLQLRLCYGKYMTISADEYRELLRIRKEALAEGTKRGTLGDPLPVMWRANWKAVLYGMGRDRDGSCLARVCVFGPGGGKAYERRVRLVREDPRPSVRL